MVREVESNSVSDFFKLIPEAVNMENYLIILNHIVPGLGPPLDGPCVRNSEVGKSSLGVEFFGGYLCSSCPLFQHFLKSHPGSMGFVRNLPNRLVQLNKVGSVASPAPLWELSGVH